jgi:hypothetical protein
MIPEIDIRGDLLPRHRVVLSALHRLSIQVPAERWCLVGGLMVLVVGRAHGAAVPSASATKDGDIVVDVLTDPEILPKATWALVSQGFVLDPAIGGGTAARCSYSFGRGQIDVLCPDGTPDDAMVTADGAQSIAIPGGRRALELSQRVDILFDDDEHNAIISVPTLHGAIVTKAAAVVDPRTSGQTRHIQDVAFLLSLIERPQEIARTWPSGDIDLLVELADRLLNDADEAWEHLDNTARRRAQATITLATRSL